MFSLHPERSSKKYLYILYFLFLSAKNSIANFGFFWNKNHNCVQNACNEVTDGTQAEATQSECFRPCILFLFWDNKTNKSKHLCHFWNTVSSPSSSSTGQAGWLTSCRTTQQHHSKQWLKLRCHMLTVPIRDPQQADPNMLSRIFSWLVGHLASLLHLWGTQAGHNGVRRGRTGAALGLGGSCCWTRQHQAPQCPLEGTGPASLPVPYRPFLPSTFLLVLNKCHTASFPGGPDLQPHHAGPSGSPLDCLSHTAASTFKGKVRHQIRR